MAIQGNRDADDQTAMAERFNQEDMNGVEPLKASVWSH